jgi:serine/threonine protein kinase
VKPGLEDMAAAPAALADTAAALAASPAPALDRTATLAPRAGEAPRAGADASASDEALAAGQQLGHFRVERRLGAGGMGEVYLATDLALDRPVALKVLPAGLARDPKLRERLIREARAQARIVHPNVGHIYFIGEEAGRLYFAMEYVAGETLAERVARGPLPVEDALDAIRAAALGLREAQRHGFLHRDVKPSNLMFDAHGVLKVLDFGLAAGAPASHSSSATSSSGSGGRTSANDSDGSSSRDTSASSSDSGSSNSPIVQTSLAGTPLYMAPEQARGDAVDLRADIYALGVTLFHLVSGRPPFVAETAAELITLHATSARPALPRLGRERAQIHAIEALCARMMAARPDDRFASYDELLRALDLASAARTRPAGFWVRSLATGLDLLLVTLVVNGALALARLLGAPNRDAMPLQFLTLALYQALAISRWGRTAGKAIFELEVVDTATLARPRLSTSLRRSLAMLGVPTLALWARDAFSALSLERAAELSEAIAYLTLALCLLLLLHASLRRSGKRALWDRLSSTVVRYRAARSAGPLQPST